MPNKPGVASSIVMPLFISFVHLAVTLNCKTGFSTKEINYIVSELVLAPKFEAGELTVSEKLPEKGFSRRLPDSQRSRELK